jgi:serine protease Do
MLVLLLSQAVAESPALEMAQRLNEAFIQVADKVSPAVVIIEVAHRPDYADLEEGDNPLLDSLPPDLRRRFEERNDKQRRERPAHHPPIYDGRGSGIVIREDGWILTNNHVVDGAEKVRIRFKDGKTYDAGGKWWTDPQSDIAVIKVAAQGLTVARLGDSAKTRVGEFAIAIGAPFDLDYSVTFGHVSAKGRSHILENRAAISMDQDFVQTDASINPGNSGGPLVNINGEVIGVNTLIRGMNRGIGFAIPSNMAKEVADHLIAEGRYARAWLGVQISALKEDQDMRDLLHGVEDGVVVQKILPNGPASKSKLRPADVIVAVEGRPVANAQQLKNEVRSKKTGAVVKLDVIRPESSEKAKRLTIDLQTEEWPDDNSSALAQQPRRVETNLPSGLGLTVKPVTKELVKQYRLGDVTEGLVVTSVEAGSLAAERRIRPGDVITGIDNKPVATPTQFQDAVKRAGSKPLLVHLIIDGAPAFRILKDSGD